MSSDEERRMKALVVCFVACATQLAACTSQKEAAPADAGSAAPVPVANEAAHAPAPPAPGPLDAGAGAADARCDETRTLARSELLKAVDHPERLAALAQIKPVPRDGGMLVQVEGLKPNSPLDQQGLQNRDVVMTINGFPFSPGVKMPDLERELRHTTQLRVVVERAGAERALCYALDAAR